MNKQWFLQWGRGGEGREQDRGREGVLVALKKIEEGCHRRWGNRELQVSVPLLKQLLIWQELTEATILDLWSVDEHSQCPEAYLTKKETSKFQQIVAFCVVTSISRPIAGSYGGGCLQSWWGYWMGNRKLILKNPGCTFCTAIHCQAGHRNWSLFQPP